MSGALAALARGLAAPAPLVGLAPRPDRRPMGVSALVRVRDEEDWIEASLRSLVGFADEIVVVDNGSTDASVERVRALAPRLGVEVRLWERPDLDQAALSNEALRRARFRWLVRWDADFVGHTAGPHALRGLREVIATVPPWRHLCLHPALVELAGDLFHQPSGLRVRWDSHLLTWSPALAYRTAVVLLNPDPARPAGTPGAPRARRAAVESLALPAWYGIRRWPTPAIFHVNVKPARRMLLRHFWQEWWAEQPGCSLEEYARRRTRAEWGAESLEAAACDYVARYCQRLVRFDPAAYGGYPALLAPALASPRYRVLYRDGRIVGRSDVPGTEAA